MSLHHALPVGMVWRTPHMMLLLVRLGHVMALLRRHGACLLWPHHPHGRDHATAVWWLASPRRALLSMAILIILRLRRHAYPTAASILPTAAAIASYGLLVAASSVAA